MKKGVRCHNKVGEGKGVRGEPNQWNGNEIILIIVLVQLAEFTRQSPIWPDSVDNQSVREKRNYFFSNFRWHTHTRTNYL